MTKGTAMDNGKNGGGNPWVPLVLGLGLAVAAVAAAVMLHVRNLPPPEQQPAAAAATGEKKIVRRTVSEATPDTNADWYVKGGYAEKYPDLQPVTQEVRTEGMSIKLRRLVKPDTRSEEMKDLEKTDPKAYNDKLAAECGE